ncbi:hypothetical protein HY345_03185 [Candidatus Microgenomates bacterium]|nr:hypothetical protein [Candidatus Microgenomates bacterium]
MSNIRKKLTQMALAGAGILLSATMVFAAAGYTFFGEADYVEPGYNSMRAVQMVSDTDPGYGGVDFEVTTGTTFADLETLATNFNATACGGGSPRFQINVIDQNDDPKNIFVYLGDYPSYSCVPNTWLSSGDLLESGKFVDTSQVGGTFYDPYDTAVANYGSLAVTGVELVTDSGWLFGSQTVMADNVDIDGTIYTFEPSADELKESCKKGGWMDYDGTSASGGFGPFKNQGQCVSTFAKM